MIDLFTASADDKVVFLKDTFVSFGKRLAMQEVTTHLSWLIATPIVGPFASWVIGFVVEKVLKLLASSAEIQAYFINMRRYTDAQGKRFDALVDARAKAETPEELERAEELSNKSFDDLVKYSK